MNNENRAVEVTVARLCALDEAVCAFRDQAFRAWMTDPDYDGVVLPSPPNSNDWQISVDGHACFGDPDTEWATDITDDDHVRVWVEGHTVSVCVIPDAHLLKEFVEKNMSWQDNPMTLDEILERADPVEELPDAGMLPPVGQTVVRQHLRGGRPVREHVRHLN